MRNGARGRVYRRTKGQREATKEEEQEKKKVRDRKEIIRGKRKATKEG